MPLRTFFSGGRIDRQSWQRIDAGLVEQKLASTAARFILTSRSGCLIAAQSAVLLRLADVEPWLEPGAPVYLGSHEDLELFVLDVPDTLAEKLDETSGPVDESASFSNNLGILSGDDAALLAYAKGIIEWRRRHKFCGLCGSPNIASGGGTILECSSAECAHRSFPRLDPAIIVLTLHGENCLLGRQQRWPEGRFSTLAGFVEPGEALEDAVRREVYEETSVRVAKSTYLGSQPWPFPSSLMIGFHAMAESTSIELLDGELAEAGWFSRADIASGSIRLPPPMSIAFRLIERWFDAGDLGPLSAFDLSSDFRSPPAA